MKMILARFLTFIGLYLLMLNSVSATYIDSLENVLTNQGNDKEKVQILNLLAGACTGIDMQKAEKYGGEALSLAQNLNYEDGECDAQTNLAYIYYIKSDLEKAKKAADEAINISERLGLDEISADSYFIKGRTLIQMNQKEEAKSAFQKCIEVSESINFLSGLAKGWKGLGDLAELNGDFDSAKEYYKEAFEYAEKSSNPNSIATGYNDLGRVYDLSGQFEIGLDYYLKGARVAEENGMILTAASLIGNVGSLHYILKNHDKAVEYATKAIELFKKVGNRKGEGVSTTTIGNVLFRQGKYEEALEIFTKVLKISEETNDKRGLSFAYNNLGKTVIKLGDVDKGREYFLKCLQYREELGFKLGVLGTSRILARSYLSTQEYIKATQYAERSLKLALEIGSYSEITPSYGVLAEIYESQGLLAKAFYFQKQYSIYRDSLLNEKKTEQLAEIQTLYETEKKEKTILEQENDILSLENRNTKITTQRNYIMAGSMALGLLGLFGYQWNKVRKERNDKREFAEALIYAQEEERKRLARDLHDGVGQSLLLIQKQLASTQQTTENNQKLISDTLQEVRSISQDLHPFQLEKFGLTTAIENSIRKVEASTDLFITKEIENIDQMLTAKAEINLYRTIQEAMSNIVKHAEATAAQVIISKTLSTISIQIKDNGKGFDPEVAIVTSKSLGLRTMKERVKNMGGTIKFSKGDVKGSIIDIILDISKRVES